MKRKLWLRKSISVHAVRFTFKRSIFTKDRAIAAEENLKHYVLTGKPLDARLTRGLIIALRFAADHECLALAKRATDEQMKPDDIKKAIKNWKSDDHRA